MSYRILVTGSREWDDIEMMKSAFRQEREASGFTEVTVVHGGARGADRMAGSLASRVAGATVEVHEANWRPLGYFDPMQGHARNQKMVSLGADVCLAFFKTGAGNTGTKDCVRRAVAVGIPVRQFWS